ncbi:hypothetical protein HDV00_002679 [Rhizophlyctis rosea]|nr:hypothetical protein HDV00_002679 [Rhizophlyctis rosea]
MPADVAAAAGLTDDDHPLSRRFLDEMYSVYTHLDPYNAGIPASKLQLNQSDVKAMYQKAKLAYQDKITLTSTAKTLLPMQRQIVQKYVAAGHWPNHTIKDVQYSRLTKRDDCNSQSSDDLKTKIGREQVDNTRLSANIGLGFGYCQNWLFWSTCWEYGYTWGKNGEYGPYKGGGQGAITPSLGGEAYVVCQVAPNEYDE